MTEDQIKIAQTLASVMGCKSHCIRNLPTKEGLSAWFDFGNLSDAAIFTKQLNDQNIPAQTEQLLMGIVFINWI